MNKENPQGCDSQHFRASNLIDHRFEPLDCTKGDVARVWFYMHDQHGVVIPDAEWNMFVGWDAAITVAGRRE
jgi:endonuclease I